MGRSGHFVNFGRKKFFRAPVCEGCAADPEHSVDECCDRDECGCRKCREAEEVEG